ncbi:glycoside hydrolase family 88/105 protein [Paenibacillus kribbensis]|uniref:glycoside hydrolase family 88/105 protein n=1 Tax=Paenibacillus kribbensis TaxID=172713 RepID=UPI00083813B0|nr:glycoside hydrolase family 88 protein [Paenibacillus kribbensis]
MDEMAQGKGSGKALTEDSWQWVEDVLRLVADRYMSDHPEVPFVFRASDRNGLRRDADCRYVFDLDSRLPGLVEGQYVYAWGKYFNPAQEVKAFSLSCFSPVRLYLNGELAYKSAIHIEVFPELKTTVPLLLQAGWNHFVLEFEKTGTGCGGKFGTGMLKRSPLHVLAPSPEREGEEGWIYTPGLDRRLDQLPGPGTAEQDTAVKWLPNREGEPEWREEEPERKQEQLLEVQQEQQREPKAATVQGQLKMGQRLAVEPGQQRGQATAAECQWPCLRRGRSTSTSCGTVRLSTMFGTAPPGMVSYAWTRVQSLPEEGLAVETAVLNGCHTGALDIYAAGELLYRSTSVNGRFSLPLPVGPEGSDVVLRSVRPAAEDWYFELAPLSGPFGYTLPVQIEGAQRDTWLHLGAFAADDEFDLRQLCRMDQLYMAQGREVYWQLANPARVVRPYVETDHYGRWNYPLGVTLLGLLQTGTALDERQYSAYAYNHISQCTAYDQYALWDQQMYGASGINHQLAAIDSLDDCGSFAATLLLALDRRELPGGAEVAARIADYIAHIQERLPDGTLYRGEQSQGIKHRTLWCDDLYMCVPFLVHYYQRTGEHRWLEDACNQLAAYRRYLYRSDKRYMSHVYDFKFDRATGIPWGRGNGWAYFALVELLSGLPSSYPQRQELLQWYQDFSAGLISWQGRQGRWHQVLDDPDSYEETSCTAMFVYGLARGLRFGWLAGAHEDYTQAVARGWQALASLSIDSQGNVSGVCRGSGYSFSCNYYKHELPSQLNDTHGIGIVLLAGVEYLAWSKEFGLQKNAIAENNSVGYSE